MIGVVKIGVRDKKSGELRHSEKIHNTISPRFRKNLVKCIVTPREWRLNNTEWDADFGNTHVSDSSHRPQRPEETFSPLHIHSPFGQETSSYNNIEAQLGFPCGRITGGIENDSGSTIEQNADGDVPLLCWEILNSDGSTDQDTEWIPEIPWTGASANGVGNFMGQQGGIVVWGPYEQKGYDYYQTTSGWASAQDDWIGIRKSGVMAYPKGSNGGGWRFEDEDGNADETCLTLKGSTLNMPTGCSTTWASASLARIGHYYSSDLYASLGTDVGDALAWQNKYGDVAFHDNWRDGNGNGHGGASSREWDVDTGNNGPFGFDATADSLGQTYREGLGGSTAGREFEWTPYAHVDFSDVAVTDADTLEIQWTIKFQIG